MAKKFSECNNPENITRRIQTDIYRFVSTIYNCVYLTRMVIEQKKYRTYHKNGR